MGSRSRKRRRTDGAPARAADAVATAPRPRRPRGEEAEALVRAQLEPLEPGERPLAVTVAAVVAGLIAVANLVLLAAGWEVDGKQPSAGGVVAFALIMVAAAVFMWRVRYWAVLGFQCLLALTALFAFLGLLRAGNAAAVLLCVALIGLSGTLFWFLVRAMARIQMPERPGSVRRHG